MRIRAKVRKFIGPKGQVEDTGIWEVLILAEMEPTPSTRIFTHRTTLVCREFWTSYPTAIDSARCLMRAIHERSLR